MKLIANSEHYGVVWYAANNHRGDTEHVLVYGLEVKRAMSFDDARRHFELMLYHAAEAAGDITEDTYE